jgi:hypothetical protein
MSGTPNFIQSIQNSLSKSEWVIVKLSDQSSPQQTSDVWKSIHKCIAGYVCSSLQSCHEKRMSLQVTLTKCSSRMVVICSATFQLCPAAVLFLTLRIALDSPVGFISKDCIVSELIQMDCQPDTNWKAHKDSSHCRRGEAMEVYEYLALCTLP